MDRERSAGTKTLYQLFDLVTAFIAILACALVIYLFRKSSDKFIYSSCAFIIVYGIVMLYVSNKTEFMRCLGHDPLLYRIIRYTTMAVIFLAVMVMLAVYKVSADEAAKMAPRPQMTPPPPPMGPVAPQQPPRPPMPPQRPPNVGPPRQQ